MTPSHILLGKPVMKEFIHATDSERVGYMDIELTSGFITIRNSSMMSRISSSFQDWAKGRIILL
jgi:hypothetical protein